MSKLKNIIREMADSPHDFLAKICQVDSVSISRRTADCIPIDGSAPFLDANLQADQDNNKGVLLVPRIGSYVLVCQTSFGQAAAVILTDDVEQLIIDTDQITINQGDNGGLVNIQPLVDRLNRLENQLNQLKTLIQSWTPAPNDGGAALKSVLSSWATQTLTNTSRHDIEDTTVVH